MTKNKKKQIAIPQDNSMDSIIARAASDPKCDVEKLDKLLDMQERVMGKQAEMAFNSAMASLQPELPAIKKTKDGHKYKYAPYDQIDRLIRPHYTEHGFSLSFNSESKGDNVHYYGTISHKEGFSRTAEMILPADTSGSKNEIQAVGSTISYAKRYLVGMLLNIVTEDEDDDAAYGNERLTPEMVSKVQELIESTGRSEARLLKIKGVNSIEHILLKDYGWIISRLKEAA